MQISIHALREEGDVCVSAVRALLDISIHALREEGDVCVSVLLMYCKNFYPRPPRGGRLDRARHGGNRNHFYPRPPRGGRRGDSCNQPGGGAISIHALREEGDQRSFRREGERRYFYPRPPRGGRPPSLRAVWAFLSISIHALREEGDRFSGVLLPRPHRFLSTPSARRATTDVRLHRRKQVDFYPRPPRGGRPDRSGAHGRSWRHFYPRPPRGGRRSHGRPRPRSVAISIHALREEGDGCFWPLFPSHSRFLSTPSARRATGVDTQDNRLEYISIHALREEGDFERDLFPRSPWNFYPRPPRGGRLLRFFGCGLRIHISIHALREEGDLLCFWIFRSIHQFLSTPSARRATFCFPAGSCRGKISIHALREEGDPVPFGVRSLHKRISIHALREEGDWPQGWPGISFRYFYPRPPRGGRRHEISASCWSP